MSEWRPTPEARREIREVAGLHDEPEIYGNPLSYMANPVERRLAQGCIDLAKELAALRKDKARLDWLNTRRSQVDNPPPDVGQWGWWIDFQYEAMDDDPTLREAIDAAMLAEGESGSVAEQRDREAEDD